MSETIQSPKQDELAMILQSEGVEAAIALPIIEKFKPHFDRGLALIQETKNITVEDADDDKGMAAAKEAAKKLMRVRTAADKTRKEEKEKFDKLGNAVQGVYKRLIAITGPEEKRLEDAAATAERAKEERLAKRKAIREAALTPYLGAQVAFMDLKSMPEEVYQKMLVDQKAAHEARIAAAAKAELDRVAAEKAKAEEDARVKAENDHLKKEAEAAAKLAAEVSAKAEAERMAAQAALEAERKAAADAAEAARVKAAKEAAAAKAKADAEAKAISDKAAAERKELEAKAAAERKALEEKAANEKRAADAIARKEREAREKVEAELAQRRAEEARRVEAELLAAKQREAEAEAAKERAARATDDDKLRTLISHIQAIEMPAVMSKSAKEIAGKTVKFLAQLVEKIEAAIEGSK